jgi:hypothetical protein
MLTVIFRITACFLTFLSALWAQGSGTIVGTVTDPSGAVVPSAEVTVTESATGYSRTAQTDSAGNYVIPSLRAAEHTVVVQASGFRKLTRTGVTLLANQDLTVNVSLELGATTENVQVEATPL